MEECQTTKQFWTLLLKSIKTEDVYFSGTILGHMPSGKNNYRISKRSMYKKPEVSQYETSFMIQIGALMGRRGIKKGDLPMAQQVMLVANVINRSWARDVDTILFCDLLQKCELLYNDRQIRFKIINGTEVDAKNPRVEFWIVKIRG